MSSPSSPLAVTGQAASEATSRAQDQTPAKVGALKGRSIIPKPAKGPLTNQQIQKICLIAAVALLVTAAVCLALPTVGLLPLSLAIVLGVFVVAPVSSFGAFVFWPRHADLQTIEGAEQARDDIKKLSLTQLVEKYPLGTLHRYGFISKDNQKELDRLYDKYHNIPRLKPGFSRNEAQREAHRRANDDALRRYQQLKQEFNELRAQPGFIL